MNRRSTTPLACALLAAGCMSSPPPPCPDCAPERARTWVYQETTSRLLDFLVVVDDTPALASRQAAATAAYPKLATVLESLTGGLPSLHATFVPAALPAPGCDPPGRRGVACGLAAPDAYLSAPGCGEPPSYQGALGDAFSCLGTYGTEACGAAQPLEAARRALAGGGAGFLRPRAHLHILIIAGADDASARDGALVPVAEYASFFRGLKADPAQVSISVIGPGGSCDGGTVGPEAAAPRLAELVVAFGNVGLYLVSCSDNWPSALQTIAQDISRLLGPRCVGQLRDLDPDREGLQPECAVESRSYELDGSVRRASLPSCDEASPPCWRLLTDPSCPQGWVFDVQPAVAMCPEISANNFVTCLGCTDPADPACALP